jgi:hypothetical protein
MTGTHGLAYRRNYSHWEAIVRFFSVSREFIIDLRFSQVSELRVKLVPSW